MLGVGTRVRLRVDRGCRRQHAGDVNGQVGTIVAVVTDDSLVAANLDPRHPSACLSLESFAGHLYTVELQGSGSLEIELCAASELEPL
jgi:hypothetical protein